MATEARVALVTGAAHGLGAAIAERLAKDGLDIVVNYHSDKEAATEVARAVESAGRRALLSHADVASPSEVRTMVAETLDAFGRLDVLVNNAGITEPEPPTETTIEKWDRMMQVDLSSVFYCCKAVMDHMISRKFGIIINMSSVCGKNGGLGAGVHYSAAKGGILGLTRGLAHHLAQHGIRVNAVAPAMIKTRMIAWRTPQQMQSTIEKIPVGRLGTVEENAAAVSYLASDRSAYVTGATIDVNGGLYMD